jgi:hypothetical protein
MREEEGTRRGETRRKRGGAVAVCGIWDEKLTADDFAL